jgi:ATP-binding cassette subfamily G (WHITE) protein 1
VELPVLIISPLVYQLIFYWGVGFQPDFGHFMYFYFITILVVFCSSGLGYFLSSSFSRPETAVMITPLVLLPLMLFGGLFSNVETIPAWIGWVQYLSPIRYGNEALIRSEFNGREYGPF